MYSRNSMMSGPTGRRRARSTRRAAAAGGCAGAGGLPCSAPARVLRGSSRSWPWCWPARAGRQRLGSSNCLPLDQGKPPCRQLLAPRDRRPSPAPRDSLLERRTQPVTQRLSRGLCARAQRMWSPIGGSSRTPGAAHPAVSEATALALFRSTSNFAYGHLHDQPAAYLGSFTRINPLKDKTSIRNRLAWVFTFASNTTVYEASVPIAHAGCTNTYVVDATSASQLLDGAQCQPQK